MNNRIDYENAVKEMTKFLCQDNVSFKYIEDSGDGEEKYNIIVNNRIKKGFTIYYNSSYNTVRVKYYNNSLEDDQVFGINNFEVRDKILKAQNQYKIQKTEKEEKLNFKILKLLIGK